MCFISVRRYLQDFNLFYLRIKKSTDGELVVMPLAKLVGNKFTNLSRCVLTTWGRACVLARMWVQLRAGVRAGQAGGQQVHQPQHVSRCVLTTWGRACV